MANGGDRDRAVWHIACVTLEISSLPPWPHRRAWLGARRCGLEEFSSACLCTLRALEPKHQTLRLGVRSISLTAVATGPARTSPAPA